jgi:hypothetical protein
MIATTDRDEHARSTTGLRISRLLGCLGSEATSPQRSKALLTILVPDRDKPPPSESAVPVINTQIGTQLMEQRRRKPTEVAGWIQAFRIAAAVVLLGCSTSLAQSTVAGPMRIVLVVDSSSAISPLLTPFRAGLNSFLDALPGDPQIAIVSTGGQLRVRIAPTTDRQKLHAAANGFAPDGGANTLLDTLLEADKRFLKTAPDRRPVFVILTTDQNATSSELRTDLYNKFMADFLARSGRAHAIVVRGANTGATTQIAENFTQHRRLLPNRPDRHWDGEPDEVGGRADRSGSITALGWPHSAFLEEKRRRVRPEVRSGSGVL